MKKTENMLAFEAALKENEELREKFAAAQKRIAENKEAGSDGELLAKAAAEVGYTITAEEFESVLKQVRELSEDDLNAVAGGVRRSSDGYEADWDWTKDYFSNYTQNDYEQSDSSEGTNNALARVR